VVPDGRAGPDAHLAGVAAWSLVHGFATLWLNGALPARLGNDPKAASSGGRVAVRRLLMR
jgi:hypothetical protein